MILDIIFMIPDIILDYFEKMQPGDTIIIANAKDSITLTAAGKEYIDCGGDLEFSNDYSIIKKLHPWPND